jgi:hypothetical protein
MSTKIKSGKITGVLTTIRKAKKIVESYDRLNPYGKVGSGVRGIIEGDLELFAAAIERGVNVREAGERAREAIIENEIGEYAL